MSARAFTNAWGDRTLYGNTSQVVTYHKVSDGSIVAGPFPDTSGSIPTARSIRDWPSNNKGFQIPGTSSHWMPPSLYERHICNIKYVAGKETWWFVPFTQTGTREGTNLGSLYTLMFPRIFASGNYSPKGTWDDNQANEAVVKAFAKIADGKAQLGANLAEAKKTFNMLCNRVVPLYQALIRAKRGDWKGVHYFLGLSHIRHRSRSITGKASSDWYLEWIYGWAPLMSDIYGTYELLKQHCGPALTLVSGRASSTEVERPQGSVGWEVSGSATRVHTANMTGRVSDATLHELQQGGLVNPLSIAWELLPWSFIIDWVVPIGKTLEALTASAGLTFVGGYVSCTCSASVIAREYPFNGDLPPQYRYTWKRFGQDIERFSYKRIPIGEWPHPQFYAKSPFSSSHATTALALARQLA